MKIWGVTDVGRVRENNEDSYRTERIGKSAALAVVCDGMGGAKAGNVASTMAVESFCTAMRARDFTKLSQDDLQELMVSALNRANSEVHAKACSDEAFSGMGTTLVAAAVSNERVTIINVGDSRAYLIDANGISRITRDHSLVEDMIALGEITELEAREHPNKNLITRAVGTEETIEGDFYTLTLPKGAYILLCSDGLSNLVSEQEMLYEVMHGKSCDDACDRLCEIANTRGGHDNITAVLMSG